MSWNTAYLNRSFGLDLNKQDAYVTGYFYGLFEQPEGVSSNTLKNILETMKQMYDLKEPQKIEKDDIPYVLSSLLLGAPTINGGTLNVDVITAMGGTKWTATGSIDYGDTFGLKFVELQGLPIFKIISSWVNLIRDRNSGRTRLKKYHKRDFSLDFVYWTTKPNGIEIESAFIFEGCYPLRDPLSPYSSDVGNVAHLEIDMDFHVDRIWVDDRAYDRAKKAYDLIKDKDKYVEGKKNAAELAVFKYF